MQSDLLNIDNTAKDESTSKSLDFISNNLLLIRPTYLYNLLNSKSDTSTLSITDPNFLLLIDIRSYEEYEFEHIVHARWCGASNNALSIPYDIELDTLQHLIIYDSNTVSIVDENSRACKFGLAIAQKLSDKVEILMGGYERFSAEYHFLRTIKSLYSPIELTQVSYYPTEIIPLSLYVGNYAHLQSYKVNYELKIRAHVTNASIDRVYADFPKLKPSADIYTVNLSTGDIADEFCSKMNKVWDFIELYRNRAERILVACEAGINESSVLAVCYLMRLRSISLWTACRYVKSCLPLFRPDTILIQCMKLYETHLSLTGTIEDIKRLVQLEVFPFKN